MIRSQHRYQLLLFWACTSLLAQPAFADKKVKGKPAGAQDVVSEFASVQTESSAVVTRAVVKSDDFAVGKDVAKPAAATVGGGSGRGQQAVTGPAVGSAWKVNAVGGPTPSDTAKSAETAPRERIDVAMSVTPPRAAAKASTLTLAQVSAKIQKSHMPSLKRCQKVHTKGLSGKGNVSFSVNESGRLVSIRISGFADEVAGCIRVAMDAWKFNRDMNNPEEPRLVSFSVPITLPK